MINFPEKTLVWDSALDEIVIGYLINVKKIQPYLDLDEEYIEEEPLYAEYFFPKIDYLCALYESDFPFDVKTEEDQEKYLKYIFNSCVVSRIRHLEEIIKEQKATIPIFEQSVLLKKEKLREAEEKLKITPSYPKGI